MGFHSAELDRQDASRTSCLRPSINQAATGITDETVKVCACNFSESAFLPAKQAIIELTLR
ncbi:MAG: hypothetical protein ABI604_11810, partial [Nitrospirota bacterium]